MLPSEGITASQESKSDWGAWREGAKGPESQPVRLSSSIYYPTISSNKYFYLFSACLKKQFYGKICDFFW